VTGSFRFDAGRRAAPEKEAELRRWTGEGRILLGGSTWPGEDEVLIGAYAKLRVRDASLKLVIAPRHFEKADAVEVNIVKAGFRCVRRSRGESAGDAVAGDGRKAVFLADTTGELMGLFGIASAAFVGKSLCEHGSQNMIEPCLCGIPTVVGPYTENFRPVMSDLLAADAIVQVEDEEGLRSAVRRFFDPGEREYAAALGERAKAAVERRRGVTERCAKDILSYLA
jgi:3-deoxy-D-manno-octulosonic-acid transferase